MKGENERIILAGPSRRLALDIDQLVELLSAEHGCVMSAGFLVFERVIQ